MKTSKNLSDDKRLYRENLSFYETKYINNEYSIIDDEMNLYLFEDIYPKPSQNSLFDMRNAFMRAKIQFLRYIYEYLNGVRREVEPELIDRIKHLRDTAIFQFILSFLNLAFLDMLSNNEKIKTTNQNVFFPS